jgi:hypothetical protein
MRCFQHLVDVIGVGEHDLIRVLAGIGMMTSSAAMSPTI